MTSNAVIMKFVALKSTGAALDWNISENALDDKEIRPGDSILEVLTADGYPVIND
jgi:hypothetical protein